jgi:tRNA dimethylallyltransferase
MQKMITILGPTATGKTKLAANVAAQLNGEIISADSRQVYRRMDIGTGKDFNDYYVGSVNIPYHLINIVEPGYEYSVYEFQKDFLAVFEQIISKEHIPILCGGTGLYLDSVLRNYEMGKAPIDYSWRKNLEKYTDDDLITQLKQFGSLHNTTDITDRYRTIRALEIAFHTKNRKKSALSWPEFKSLIFGVKFDRSLIRKRITRRLLERLENGMIEEIENLIKSGLEPEQLMFYGLEYKFITLYLTGKMKYDEMVGKLNIAIHQFAKRQMTWFRRMEKNGIEIDWVNGENSIEENSAYIVKTFRQSD